LTHAGLKKGGHLAALLFALGAVAWPCRAEADIPWGGGCAPVAAGEQRTAANCGAALVDGEAIPPPGAPSAVKQLIQAANEIRHRSYVWGGGHRGWVEPVRFAARHPRGL
jgi:hypothetical protein